MDKEGKDGLFYLSGSQQFKTMKNISETLAGRLGILNLLGLSIREIYNINITQPFLPIKSYFEKRKTDMKKIEYNDLWKIIHKGFMPRLYANNHMNWQMFYSSHVKTYIERDVRDLAKVGDEQKFLKFMVEVASQTGNLLNLSSLLRDEGISAPTANR